MALSRSTQRSDLHHILGVLAQTGQEVGVAVGGQRDEIVVSGAFVLHFAPSVAHTCREDYPCRGVRDVRHGNICGITTGGDTIPGQPQIHTIVVAAAGRRILRGIIGVVGRNVYAGV